MTPLKLKKLSLLIISLLIFTGTINSQNESDDKTIDIIWLKDGSRLRGTILEWDLEKGMKFQLATGATIFIEKTDIEKVVQESTETEKVDRSVRNTYLPRPYSFREQGWYHNTSGFLNISAMGGAGVHHVMGYRFNRMFGVGLGTGIESHDFNWVRNIVPVYAEARGFFLPQKITPYYAVKIGYGFALNDPNSGTTDARGGFHFSPELGMRFGGGDVSYYLGLEYKIQNASFTNEWWGGGTSRDEISYRRLELRTGLLF